MKTFQRNKFRRLVNFALFHKIRLDKYLCRLIAHKIKDNVQYDIIRETLLVEFQCAFLQYTGFLPSQAEEDLFLHTFRRSQKIVDSGVEPHGLFIPSDGKIKVDLNLTNVCEGLSREIRESVSGVFTAFKNQLAPAIMQKFIGFLILVLQFITGNAVQCGLAAFQYLNSFNLGDHFDACIDGMNRLRIWVANVMKPQADNGQIEPHSGEKEWTFAEKESFVTSIWRIMCSIFGTRDISQMKVDTIRVRRLTDFIATVRSMSQLIDWMRMCATTALISLYEYFTGRPYLGQNNDKLSLAIQSWMNRVTAMYNDSGMLKIANNFTMASKALMLKKQGDDLHAHLTSLEVKSAYLSSFNIVYSQSKAMFDAAAGFLKSSEVRIKPIWINLFGPSGVGKSMLQRLLTCDLAARNEVDFDSNLEHERKIFNEFWDGYSSQFCVTMDDFYQSTESRTRELCMLEMFAIANDLPFQLHMASIDAKSNTMFVSPLVITSMNEDLSKENAGPCTTMEAFMRRRDFNVYVDIAPQHKGINPLNGNPIIKGGIPDVPGTTLCTNVYRFELRSALDSRIVLRTGLDYKQLLEILDNAFKKRHTQGDSVTNQLKERHAFVQSEYRREQAQSQDDNPRLRAIIEAQEGKWDDLGYSLPDVVNSEGVFTNVEPHFAYRISDIDRMIQFFPDMSSQDINSMLFNSFDLNDAVRKSYISILRKSNCGEAPLHKFNYTVNDIEYIRTMLPQLKYFKIIEVCHNSESLEQAAYLAFLQVQQSRTKAQSCAEWTIRTWNNFKDRFVGSVFPEVVFNYRFGESDDSEFHDAQPGIFEQVQSKYVGFQAKASTQFQEFKKKMSRFPDDVKYLWHLNAEEDCQLGADEFRVKVQATKEACSNVGSTIVTLLGIVASVFAVCSLIYLGFSKYFSGASSSVEPQNVSGDDKTRRQYRRMKHNNKIKIVKTTPVVAKPINTLEAQSALLDDCALQLCQNKLRANLVQIVAETPGASAMCQEALFLCGNYFITSRHFFVQFEGLACVKLTLETEKGDFPFYLTDIQNMWFEEDSDYIVVKCPKNVPNFYDIRKNFIYEEDLMNSFSRDGTMMHHVEDILCFTTLSKLKVRKSLSYYGTRANGEQYVQECARAIEYEGGVQRGMCGSPIVTCNKKLPRKILGIHVAGRKGESYGYGALITQERLNAIFEEEKQEILEPFNLETQSQEWCKVNLEDCELYDFDVKDGAVVGQVSKKMNNYFPGITKIRKSVIYEKVFPAFTLPCFTNPKHPTRPLHKALAKYATSNVVFKEEEIAPWKERLATQYRHILISERSILTPEQALTGEEGRPYSNRVDLSTSASHPCSKLKARGGDKHEWVDEIDGCLSPKPELLVQINEALDMARRGKVFPILWPASLKDERRDVDRVNAGKTRLFMSTPFHLLVMCKMYMGRFAEAVMTSREGNECQVGINPHSLEWQRMFDNLRDVSIEEPNWIAGDYSNYDGSIPAQFGWAICDIINEWYDDGEENARIRRCIFYNVINAHILVGRTVFSLSKGNPSGWFLTWLYNSFANVMYVGMAFNRIAKRLRLKPTQQMFDQTCRVAVFGDDNLISVQPEAMWFNFQSLSEELASMGIRYTGAVKSQEMELLYTPRADITFLKRKFVMYKGVMMAPLNRISIQEMTNWVHDTSPADEAIVANVRQVLTEMVHYGPEEYTWMKNRCNEALCEVGIRPVQGTWNEVFSAFFC